MTQDIKGLPARLRDALQLYSAALEDADAHMAVINEAANTLESLLSRQPVEVEGEMVQVVAVEPSPRVQQNLVHEIRRESGHFISFIAAMSGWRNALTASAKEGESNV